MNSKLTQFRIILSQFKVTLLQFNVTLSQFNVTQSQFNLTLSQFRHYQSSEGERVAMVGLLGQLGVAEVAVPPVVP